MVTQQQSTQQTESEKEYKARLKKEKRDRDIDAKLQNMRLKQMQKEHDARQKAEAAEKKEASMSWWERQHRAEVAQAKERIKRQREDRLIYRSKHPKKIGRKKGYGMLGLKKRKQGHRLNSKRPIGLI